MGLSFSERLFAVTQALLSAQCSCLPQIPTDTARAFRPQRPGPVDQVIIHAMSGTFEGTRQHFRNPPPRAVSAHYLISRTGRIVAMVPERAIAYHAGVWMINERSIGIELEDGGPSAYLNDPKWATDALYDSAARLTACIAGRHKIPISRGQIRGHSDIGTGKADPGPYWDWDRFFRLVQQVSKTCS